MFVSPGDRAGRKRGANLNGWERPFTKPLLNQLQTVNTANYTLSDDTNGIFVQGSTLTAGDHLCLVHQPVPSGAWALTCRVNCQWVDDGAHNGGVHVYETSTGKALTMGPLAGNEGSFIVGRWSGLTGGTRTAIKNLLSAQRWTWLRWTYDGTTNYLPWWSMDGYSWIPYGTNIAKTTPFTTAGTHAGFYLDSSGANYISAIKCLSFTLG